MEAWICMTHFVLSRNTSSYHTYCFLTLALPGFLFQSLTSSLNMVKCIRIEIVYNDTD